MFQNEFLGLYVNDELSEMEINNEKLKGIQTNLIEIFKILKNEL